MEAVRLYKKNLIKVENIHFEDSLKDDQVLVEIAYAGICGSDLHNYKTGCWISRSPSTPGHEFSGKICNTHWRKFSKHYFTCIFYAI